MPSELIVYKKHQKHIMLVELLLKGEIDLLCEIENIKDENISSNKN